MAQVRLGSGFLGRIKGAKAPEIFCGGKRVFLLGLGACLFYSLYYQQREGTAVVVMRAWFVRMNLWTYVPRCA